MTQCERVLKASRGLRGVTQGDFAGPHTVDGGPTISRVAARIQDLKDQGHTFDVIGERNGFRVYRLNVDVDRASGTPSCPGVPSERLTDSSSAAGPMSTDTLFGMPRVKPAVSPYDPMSDAA